MPVHVKMLDKDGVGFRLITVEDPVCLQLIATDPNIGDYPVIRVGIPPAPVMNYPLTGDAYVMNENGETISKVAYKDCLREIGKADVPGMRPDRKGLEELQPFPQQIRDVFRTSSLTIGTNLGAVKPIPFKPRVVDINPDFREISCIDNEWKIDAGGKMVSLSLLNGEDILRLKGIIRQDQREDFAEYLAVNHPGSKTDVEAIGVAIARVRRLHEAYVKVAGDGLYGTSTFTPLEPDPELGGHLYALIDGQKTHVSGLSLGDVMIDNVFYLNPLAVNPEDCGCDPEIMEYMLDASTVYYHARPQDCTDDIGIKGWIDYQFSDGKRKEEPKEEKLDPIEPVTFPFNPDEMFSRLYKDINNDWRVGINRMVLSLCDLEVQHVVSNRVWLHPRECAEFDSWVVSKEAALKMDKLFDHKVALVKRVGEMVVKALDEYGPNTGHYLTFHPVSMRPGFPVIRQPSENKEPKALLILKHLSLAEIAYYKVFIPNDFGSQDVLVKELGEKKYQALVDNTTMLKFMYRGMDVPGAGKDDSTVLEELQQTGIVPKEENSTNALVYAMDATALTGTLSHDLREIFFRKACESIRRFPNRKVYGCVTKAEVGLVASECVYNVSLVVDNDVMWVGCGARVVSDKFGAMNHLIADRNHKDHTWYIIVQGAGHNIVVVTKQNK